MQELIGIEVRHKKFGIGKVNSIDGAYINIVFGEKEKSFSFPMIFDGGNFIKAVDDSIQQKIQEFIENQKEEEQKRKDEEKAKKDAEEEQRRIEEKKKISERQIKRKATGRTVWIKFEGAQNENAYANVHKVPVDDNTWYVLHYKMRPVNVKDGDAFFMAEGITDSNGRPRQVITGRGHLYKFSEDNYSPDEWVKIYSWIPSHPWYVVIKDFEILDAPIRNGLMLEQVITDVGAETYVASSGQDRDYEDLMHIHCRRTHMMLTEEAEEYINEKFDELVNRFGSQKFETVL